MGMLVAIPTTGNDLDGQIEERFGRCPRFIIADPESLEFRVMVNPALTQSGGAGVRAAQAVVDSGADAVIAGEIGPKAYQVLERAGIRMFTKVTGTVKDSLAMLSFDGPVEAEGPTVPARHEHKG